MQLITTILFISNAIKEICLRTYPLIPNKTLTCYDFAPLNQGEKWGSLVV
jgi:hypothetical protein